MIARKLITVNIPLSRSFGDFLTKSSRQIRHLPRQTSAGILINTQRCPVLSRGPRILFTDNEPNTLNARTDVVRADAISISQYILKSPIVPLGFIHNFTHVHALARNTAGFSKFLF
jgi:hypothetical protein